MGNLVDLRKILAHLYPTQQGMQRIAYDSGLNWAYIRLDDAAINCWHNILIEAENRGHIEMLIKVVSNEYYGNSDLRRAVEVYRLSATTGVEDRTIALIFQELQQVEKYLVVPYDEWPTRPKDSKRSETWDILEKFKLVVRCGWHYHHCKDEQRREVVVAMASFCLDQTKKDTDKLPYVERSSILSLVETWRKVFYQTKQNPFKTRQNPFIFQEPLRGRKPFVGREQQLKALKAAGTSGSTQPVWLYGLVHSGKSSLIHKATLDYYETICFTSFSIVETEKAGLSVKTVLWAMCQALNRRTQHALPDEKSFQLDPFAATEEMIRVICRRFPKVTQMIVVGNFDYLYVASSGPVLQGMTITSRARIADSLIRFWWRLAESIGSVNFVFVSQTAESPTTPFTPYLQKIQVGLLEFKEIEKLLNTPTPDFIPLFSRRAAALVFHLTGGQPYLAQLLAHCVLSQFNRDLDTDAKPEPVFLEDDIEAAAKTPLFEQFSQPYFRSLLDQLETLMPGSNTVLRVIAPHIDGITTPALEEALSSRYTWGALELILSFLQEQQIVKEEEGWWLVVGELLRREVAWAAPQNSVELLTFRSVM